jgi:hypothetical protein
VWRARVGTSTERRGCSAALRVLEERKLMGTPTTHYLLLYYGWRSQSKEPHGILGVIMSNHQ